MAFILGLSLAPSQEAGCHVVSCSVESLVPGRELREVLS